MQIIVKGLKGFKVYQETEDYINKKFCKLDKMIKEPTVLEFSILHTHSSKQTLDKTIHLTATLPGLKKPEHLEETSTHFTQSIDKLLRRFSKILNRHHDKIIDLSRRPRKYYAAKKKEEKSGEI